MARYQCINKNCINYDKISDDLWIHQQYKDNRVIDMNLECPICHKLRKVVESTKDKKGLCTHAYGGNGNICNK